MKKPADLGGQRAFHDFGCGGENPAKDTPRPLSPQEFLVRYIARRYRLAPTMAAAVASLAYGEVRT